MSVCSHSTLLSPPSGSTLEPGLAEESAASHASSIELNFAFPRSR